MQFTMNLVGGAPAKRQETPGRYLVLLDTGAATSVELRVFAGNVELENIRTAQRGLKLTAPEGFTHVEVKSTVDAALELVISMGRVDVGFIDGVKVNATIVNPLPVPVQNDRGTPGNLLYVSGVTVADGTPDTYSRLPGVPRWLRAAMRRSPLRPWRPWWLRRMQRAAPSAFATSGPTPWPSDPPA
jgi:hypothetical protein